MLKIIAKRTELFNYTKGVRQGRPLSPLPFNNFTNDMVKCLNKMNPQPLKLNKTYRVVFMQKT